MSEHGGGPEGTLASPGAETSRAETPHAHESLSPGRLDQLEVERQRLDYAFAVFQNTQEIIRFLDQKALGLMIALGLFYSFFANWPREVSEIMFKSLGVRGILFALTLLTFFVTSLAAFHAVFAVITPRPFKTKIVPSPTLVYFAHISFRKDAKDYTTNLLNVTPSAMVEDIGIQIYEISKICLVKQFQLNRAFFWLGVLIPAWLLVILQVFLASAGTP